MTTLGDKGTKGGDRATRAPKLGPLSKNPNMVEAAQQELGSWRKRLSRGSQSHGGEAATAEDAQCGERRNNLDFPLLSPSTIVFLCPWQPASQEEGNLGKVILNHNKRG